MRCSAEHFNWLRAYQDAIYLVGPRSMKLTGDHPDKRTRRAWKDGADIPWGQLGGNLPASGRTYKSKRWSGVKGKVAACQIHTNSKP